MSDEADDTIRQCASCGRALAPDSAEGLCAICLLRASLNTISSDENTSEEPAQSQCAEANPADCHRSLIADALSTQGVTVVHLLDPGRSRPHEPHPALRPGPDGTPTYTDVPRLFPEVRASEHGGRIG